LKCLKLEPEALGREGMESLLDCLYGQSSISSLTLKEGSMDAPAWSLLKEFLGTRKEGDTLGVSSLVELTLDCVDVDDASGLAWASFASVFWTKHEHVETIGSCIRSLSIAPSRGYGILQELARNAHRIALTRLTLYDLDAEECKHLAQYLFKTTCLRELDLDGVDNLDLIMRSFRSNGTLHQVVEWPWPSAHTFCMRNKLLCLLLHDLAGTEFKDKDSKVGCTTDSMKRRHAKSLLPTLLQSAKHITALRAPIILTTLLELGESAGPLNSKASGK
jgi:hypothetical protein